MAKNAEVKSTIDAVATKLLADIDAGRYAEGDQLPARADLAKEFNLSKSAIRVALKRVAEKHPLDFVPGRGVFLHREVTPTKALTLGLIGKYSADALSGDRRIASYYGPILENVVAFGTARQSAVTAIPGAQSEPFDLDRIACYGADCLVCHGTYPEPETFLELKRRGVPLVLGHRGDDSLPRLGCSYVDYDWCGGFRMAVRAFHERGHRRIAFCVGDHATGGGHELSREAFLLECAERGLANGADLCRVEVEIDYPSVIARQVRDLLALPEPPTAFVLKCPWYEMGPIERVFAECGVRPGRDASLITLAISGTENAATTSCLLEPARKIGRKLVETALRLVEAPHEVHHVDVPFEFLDKGGIVCPPATANRV